MEEVGRRRYVVVNPALVEGASVKRRQWYRRHYPRGLLFLLFLLFLRVL